MHLKKMNKGTLLVLGTGVISGFSIFVNSIGVKEFDSSIFTFMKNALVAIFLLSIILGFGQLKELRVLRKKQWLNLVLIGLIGGSIPFLLFFRGLQMTTGTTSSFLHKTIFVYASIFALIFLKEKVSKYFVAGASMILLGNYFLIKPSFEFSSGHVLIILAAIFWAAENTYAKHVMKELNGTIVAFGRMFFGSLFILVFLLATKKIGLISTLNMTHYLWILLTSIFLLLYVMTYYNGLKLVSVSTATSVLSIGAPITTLLSFIFAGKQFTLLQGFGILLIFAGVAQIVFISRNMERIKDISVTEHGRD